MNDDYALWVVFQRYKSQLYFFPKWMVRYYNVIWLKNRELFIGFYSRLIASLIVIQCWLYIKLLLYAKLNEHDLTPKSRGKKVTYSKFQNCFLLLQRLLFNSNMMVIARGRIELKKKHFTELTEMRSSSQRYRWYVQGHR